MCNQSLMKLVTPEDDEPDEPKPVAQKQTEPNPEDSLPKQEGAASGEYPDVRVPISAAGETQTGPGTKLVVSLTYVNSSSCVPTLLLAHSCRRRQLHPEPVLFTLASSQNITHCPCSPAGIRHHHVIVGTVVRAPSCTVHLSLSIWPSALVILREAG